MRHNAFVYEDDGDYVLRSTPFLKEGLECGEAAIVAATRDRIALLREALGSDAQRVSFIDNGSAYTRPARTLAAYNTAVLEHLRGAHSARLVAGVQLGPMPAEWDEWMAYEAIFNRSLSHLSAWVVCTYDGRTAPDPVVEDVWRTHPEVLTDDWRSSDHFEDPAAVVRAKMPSHRSLPELRSVSPGDDLETFRERLARELSTEGVPAERALNMLVAANEVAANAWQYGGGLEELRVGTADGRFVCEVCDRGPGFNDPFAGYIPPNAGARGPGLWVARQLAWRVENVQSPNGHTVRLWL